MWSGRHGSGGLVDEEAAAFPGHFLASFEERIRFVSADVCFLLRSNCPIFHLLRHTSRGSETTRRFSSVVHTRGRLPAREHVNPDTSVYESGASISRFPQHSNPALAQLVLLPDELLL